MNPACAAGTRASRQEDGGRSPKDRWITPGDPVFRSRASWERFDFPEDFLLADASMTTKRMELFSVKEDATAAQETMIKAFVARSRRSRMSPSQSPPSTRIIPMSFLRTPRRHYTSTPASTIMVDNKQPSYALPSYPLLLRTLFIRKMDGFNYASEASIT